MLSTREKSQSIFSKSCEKIPGGVNSPVRAFSGLGIVPMIVKSGKGDMITDVDNNQYIDFCCSWGPLINGHAHPQILQGVQEQMQLGTSFGIATEIEFELADYIVNLIDPIEKIRFVSSGTEATMTALRLARGYTKKSHIIKFTGNYHGHADSLLVQAGSHASRLNVSATSGGVPEQVIEHTICLEYNNIDAIDAFFKKDSRADDVAAIIVEPVACNMGVVPAQLGFLQKLRESATKYGTLLIYDEVITGFRVGQRGALDLYPITPDLICYGKIVGGGFPVGAFGGSAEIMNHLAPQGAVYQAGTLSGNPVAMRAGLENLKLLSEPDFFQKIEAKANRITKPIREKLIGKDACIQQVGSLFTIFFGCKEVQSKADQSTLDPKTFAACFRYLFNKGIYIPPSQQEAWFVSSVHTEKHLDYTANQIMKFIDECY